MDRNIKQIAYGKYQLDWMKQHGYSLADLVDVMNQAWREDEDRERCTPGVAFNMFERDYGFGGELYSSYDEFLENEYLSMEDMLMLLTTDEAKLYLQDVEKQIPEAEQTLMALESKERLREAKKLWLEFGTLPMDPETECMEMEFEGFPAGTHREEIWHWFEEHFNVSVAKDLMGLEGEQ